MMHDESARHTDSHILTDMAHRDTVYPRLPVPHGVSVAVFQTWEHHRQCRNVVTIITTAATIMTAKI